MMFYEPGELFDEQIYEKVNRRKSDLIFCNVEFEHYGRTYCYLADSDDYAVGDNIIVPVGPNNQENVAKIQSIEYCQPENAPYPVEKTKHILRKTRKPLDYHSEHFCPVYDRIISADLCYDSLCCLSGMFLVSSTKELAEIEDIESARVVCKECPYSEL